jgi:hypothetical protein
MKFYKFVIGSMDSFQSLDELKEAVGSGENLEKIGISKSQGNIGIFEYEIESLSDQVALMYGRGLAFSRGWCMDDTFSFCQEVDSITNNIF